MTKSLTTGNGQVDINTEYQNSQVDIMEMSNVWSKAKLPIDRLSNTKHNSYLRILYRI